MSAVATLLAAALPAPLRANFGDDAVYAPPAPDAPVHTWTMRSISSALVSDYGQTFEPRMTATLPRSDVTLPKIGATLTVGAVTYRIDQVVEQDELFTTVALISA